MASFNKFNVFSQDLGRKVHNLNADVLKVMLSNVAPVATNAVLADLTEIAAGNGYAAGGAAAASPAYAQAGGVGKLTASNVVFTASGGSFATFRYAVLYNSTASGGPLIGWFDYGAPVTLTSGNPFTISWDAVNGILTVT
jgi:hypothetical protein